MGDGTMRTRGKELTSLKTVLFIFTLFLAIHCFNCDADAARIKDIATIQGVRNNSLIGYGLVIGLSGTGDKTGTTFTVQTLTSMLNKMGITVDPKTVKVKNVAAVMVTANLPPFVRAGSTIDVVVSSMGDATSLQGGTLLLTPLKGADQEVYAVAQGSVSVGGFLGGKGGDSIQKNHPTAGRIASGALIEKEVKVHFADKKEITILLRSQDFTTAVRVSQAINGLLGAAQPPIATATPVDGGTVRLQLSETFQGNGVELLAMIESLDIEIDFPAKVVVNERTGTIVMGNRVKISDVAIAHGNLTIQVQTDIQVSQPPPFAPEGAETVVVPQREITVTEEDSKIVLIGGTTIGDLIRGLNAIGVSPRDLISVLQAIKAAGALHAELEII